MSGYAFSSMDELGEGPGFRRSERALGVTAFGVNGVCIHPGSWDPSTGMTSRTSSISFIEAGRASK